MVSRTLVCIPAIALGLYGAWWASSLAHFFYLEKVNSFDDLSTFMLMWFAVAAVVFCPLLCWSFLKVLKRMRKSRDA
jgi:uncharacterized membrane protein YeaQ/YmgE (transglycosylase-associated protein family)